MATEAILPVSGTATSGEPIVVGELAAAPFAADQVRTTNIRLASAASGVGQNFNTNANTTIGSAQTSYVIGFVMNSGVTLYWRFATANARNTALTDDVMDKLAVT